MYEVIAKAFDSEKYDQKRFLALNALGLKRTLVKLESFLTQHN